VRLGEDEPAGPIGEPGRTTELVEFRRVAAPLFMGAGALAVAGTIASVVFADPMIGFRPVPLMIIALCGLLLGVGLATTTFVIRPWMIHLCGAFACSASTLGAYFSGPSFGPYSEMFLILTAIALVMFLDRRGSFVLLVLIGVAQAWLLFVRAIPSPGTRWLFLVGICSVGAATVDALVGRLAESSRAAAVARRAAEESRVEADHHRLLMEEASRHKTEFLANMSHELRTPLNAVIGFAEVLGGQHFGHLNERQVGYVEDIRGAGRHLLALINDVLDLAKVEAGRMDLEPHWFSLGESVAAAINLVRPSAEAGQLVLRVDIPPDALDAYGDQRRIQQVLVNLLTNAVKFTPPDGTVDVVARASADGTVVEVHDTGVGISPEDQARVFDDFQQVGVPDRRREGTGLGLALTKRFLELHGGDIWVRSEPGIGSTFGFRLPAPAHAALLP
ncbi:MAG: sensor histidine kinase, partial [Acidimicrobiales bacterium]